MSYLSGQKTQQFFQVANVSFLQELPSLFKNESKVKVQTNWHIIKDLGHGDSSPCFGAFGRGKMLGVGLGLEHPKLLN